jgi:hypothetical protein
MMGCAVLTVLGIGVLVVMLLLTVADPLEGEDSDGEGDSTGSPYGSPVGAEDQSGPAWLSSPGR